MLNCGTTNDLKSILSFSGNLKCYVIDCHRPVVINNVTDEQNVYFGRVDYCQIIVINDGSIDMADIPSDISDDDDDNNNNNNAVEDDDNSLSDDLDNVSDTELENRKRRRAERLSYLQHKDKKRRMINEYNAFNFYSRPASIIVALACLFYCSCTA